MMKRKQLAPQLFLLAAVLVPGLAAAQSPNIFQQTAGDTPVSLGFAVGGSRYDNDFQSYYQTTLALSAAVRVGSSISASATMPMSGGFTPKSACCRYSLGNATVGLSSVVASSSSFTLTLPVSLSLPTASTAGDGRRNALYTATSEITRNPGLYLPGTTTVRTGVVGQYRDSLVVVSAAAGATWWSTDSDSGRHNAIVIPLSLEGGWRALEGVTPTFGLRAIVNPQSESKFAASAEAGLSYVDGAALYRLRVALPVDAESRSRNLISITGAMSWNI